MNMEKFLMTRFSPMLKATLAKIKTTPFLTGNKPIISPITTPIMAIQAGETIHPALR